MRSLPVHSWSYFLIYMLHLPPVSCRFSIPGLPKVVRFLAPWEGKVKAVPTRCWTKFLIFPIGRVESPVLSQDLGLRSRWKNRKSENTESLTWTWVSQSPKSCCTVRHCSLIAVSPVRVWDSQLPVRESGCFGIPELWCSWLIWLCAPKLEILQAQGPSPYRFVKANMVL